MSLGDDEAPRDGREPIRPSSEAGSQSAAPPEATGQSAGNLGFELSFIEGKALVGFTRRELTGWLRALDLTLEVPHITFPFDVTAGAETFRNRRCRLIGVGFEVDEPAFREYLLDRLRPLASLEGSPIERLELAFGEGFIEVGGDVAAGRIDETGGDARVPGGRFPFSLKVGIDASAEREIRLLVHDARIYAPSSLPAPAVAVAFLDLVAKSGLPVEVDPPSTIRLDPVSRFVRWLLPRHGWKLPDTRDARLTSANVEGGRARLVFDAGKSVHPPPDSRGMRSFLSALEGSLAFSSAEEALAAGRYEDARRAWLVAEGPLPDHPFAAERLLTLMQADPSTVDDALDLAEAWLERDARFVPALLTRAMIRVHRGAEGAAADLLEVASIAAERHEVLGARYAASSAGRMAELEAVSAADAGRFESAEATYLLAAEAFERALETDPSHKEALVALSRVYPKLADLASTERALRRRLDVASSDEERADIHLSLGRLHSGDHSSVGVPSEARAAALRSRREHDPFEPQVIRAKLHLDAALRHDPDLAEAWLALGRACGISGEPLRAVRCLDKSRELLVSEGRHLEAAQAAREIAVLWEKDLDHVENAILRYQQVLEALPEDVPSRLRHAELSLSLGHVTEAESGLQSVLETIARARKKRRREDGSDEDHDKAALIAHRELAKIARRHYGANVAALRHLEKALRVCDQAGTAKDRRDILDEIVEAADDSGDAAYLADACDRAASSRDAPAEQASLLSRAAHLYLTLGDGSTARSRAARARALDPEGFEPMVARAAVEAEFGTPTDHAAALADLARHTPSPSEKALYLFELGQIRLEALEAPSSALSPLAEARDTSTDPSMARAAARLHLAACRATEDPSLVAESLKALAGLLESDGKEKAKALLEAARINEEELSDEETARELVASARKADPEDPLSAWHLGRLLLRGGDAPAAWSAFLDMNALGGAEAAEVASGEADPVLGEAAHRAGDLESAARHLGRALEESLADEELERRVLHVLEELGRSEEAASVLRRTAEAKERSQDPAAAAKRWRRAAHIAEHDLHDPANAASDLDAALRATLTEEEALASIGEGLTRTEAHDEALAAAEDKLRLAKADDDAMARAGARLRLAALCSDSAEAARQMSKRAEDLLLAGDEEDAARSLELAVILDPHRTEARERLIESLRESRPADALEHVERLLPTGRPVELKGGAEGEPPAPDVLERRLDASELALSAGLHERARHHLAIYVAHRPGDTAATSRLIQLLREAGRDSDLYSILVHHAHGLLDAPQATDEDLEEASETLLEAASIALGKLDRPQLASAALEKLLEHRPDHVPALESFLSLLHGPGKEEARADVLGRLAEQAQDTDRRASYLCDRAATLAALRPKQARESYERALEQDPSSKEAAEGLAGLAWSRADLLAFTDACEVRARQAADTDETNAATRLLVAARLRLDFEGDPAGGLSLLDLALSLERRGGLDPADEKEALRRRLSCRLSAGDGDGAIDDLSELISITREEATPGARAALHRQRAGLREAASDEAGAREDWAEAHRLDRDDPLALDRLMSFARLDEDYRALAHLYSSRADLERARGKPDAAARSLLERSRLLAGPLESPAGAAAAAREAVDLAADVELRRELLSTLRSLLVSLDLPGEAVDVALEEASILPDRDAAGLLLEAASAAEAGGHHGKALAATRSAAKRAPEDLPVAAALLLRLTTAGASKEALAPARLLTPLDPAPLATALDLGESEATDLLRLGCLVLADEAPKEALPLLSRLRELRPGDHLLVETLTQLCLENGDVDRARQTLEAHFGAVRPRHRARIARRLADLAAALENHEDEARWLKEIASLEKALPEGERERLLCSLLRTGRTEEYASGAQDSLTDVSSTDPERAKDELARHTRSLLEHRGSKAALDLLARFDDLRGDSLELIELWLAAAEAEDLTEVAVEARGWLVQQLIEEGDEEAAAKHLIELGAAHEEGGEIEDAFAALHEALLHGRRAPETVDRALALARRLDDPSREADILELAVEAAPDKETAAGHLTSLATLFSGPLESPGRAEASLRSALDCAPEHEPAFTALQAILLSEDRREELARLLIERAERQGDEGDGEPRLLAARHLMDAGEPKKAVEQLLTARSRHPEVFAREEGERLLDDARARGGMHRERAEERLASQDQPGNLTRLIEAGDILREELDDAEAAAEAYWRAYREGDGQRAAERLRGVLADLGDHRGLATLALDEASVAPSGHARVGLLRSAGDLLSQAGDRQGAIETWQRGLSESPGDRALLERLKSALEEEGRHAELAEVVRMLADEAAGASRAEALIEAARLHQTAGDGVSAVARLLEAEEASPTHDEVLLLLGDALWDADSRDEATNRYLRVLPKEPLSSRAHERVSEHLEAEGRLDELAEVTLARATAARAEDEERLALDLYLRTVRLWLRAGRPEATRPAACGAFSLNPADEEAFEAAMRLASETADPGWALEILETHLRALPAKSPKRTERLRRLVEARCKAGDRAGALDDLDELLELAPEDTGIAAWAFRLSVQENLPGSQERARRLAGRLVELGEMEDVPRPPREDLEEAYRVSAQVALEEERPKEAAAHYASALSLATSDTRRKDLAGRLGEAALSAGEHETGGRAFVLLADLETDEEPKISALRKAAEAFEVRGDEVSASEAWRRLFELRPEDSRAHAALEALTQEPEKRLALLRAHTEAVTDPDRRPRLLLAIGDLSEEVGDGGLATRSRLEAWRLAPDDREAASQALPALRSGSGKSTASELASALELLSKEEPPSSAALMLCEAAAALESSGELERARDHAIAALEIFRCAMDLDGDDGDDGDDGAPREALAVAAMRVLETAAPHLDDPSEKAALHRLAARAATSKTDAASLLAGAADLALEDDDLDGARRDLASALEATPEDPSLASRLVELHLEARAVDDAAELSLSIFEDEGPASLLLRVADAAEKEDRRDLTAQLLSAALRLEKQAPDVHRRLVDARLDQDDLNGAADAAKAYLHRLEETGADADALVEAKVRAARLFSRAGRPLEARAVWELVLEQDPGHEEAVDALEAWHEPRGSLGELASLHENRAERLVALGRMDDSVEASVAAADTAKRTGDLARAMDNLETGLRRRPGSHTARSRLSELIELAGRDDDDELTRRALEAALESRDSDEEKAKAALSLARHHRSKGRDQAATETYSLAFAWAKEQTMAMEPGAPIEGLAAEIIREAGIWLAERCLAEGDAEASHEMVSCARRAGAGGRKVRALEGRAAEAAGELEAARDVWKALAEEDYEDDTALEGLLRVSGVMEDVDAELWALTRLAEKAANEPGAAELWLAVARRAESGDRIDEARRALLHAFHIEPTSRTIFNLIRNRLERWGDIVELLDLLRRWARFAEDDTAKADAFLEEGRLARERAGDLERAARAFERCLAIDPKKDEATAALADVLHEMGAHEQAETVLRSLPRGGPGLPAHLVHQRLGEYALAGRRLEDAVEAFKTAASFDPSCKGTFESGLKVARETGDTSAEIELLEGVLHEWEDMEDTERLGHLVALSQAKRRAGAIEEATRHLSDARSLSPDDEEILLMLLEMYREQDAWSEAAEVLSELAGMTDEGPGRASLLIELADLLAGHLDDPHGADVALRSAAATDPDNVEVWRRILARAVTARERSEMARAAQKMASLGEEEALAQWPLEIGRALLDAGAQEAAAPLLETASKERPGNRVLASEAAAALMAAKEMQRARELLDALAQRTGSPLDYRAAAEASLIAGDERGFVDKMKKGLEDTDLCPEVRARGVHAIALRLIELKETKEAMTLLRDVVELLPADRRVRHDLGHCLMDSGDDEEAREVFLELARSDPSDAEAIAAASKMVEEADPDRARLLRALFSYLLGEPHRRTTGSDEPEEPDDGGGEGAERQALDLSSLRVDAESRRLLSDPVASGPMARLLREISWVLEPLFPSELQKYGVSTADLLLPESDPAAERAMRWAQALEARPFALYRAEHLGFEIRIENTRPAGILIGAALLDAGKEELDQILCRAVELVASGYTLPGKFADRDVEVLMRLALSFFDSSVEVPIPDDKVRAYHEAMSRLCPEERKSELSPLAKEALDQLPDLDPGSLAPALRRTADRVTLLCTGDVEATLDSIQRLNPRSSSAESDRRTAVRTDPALFDLCRFMLRDDMGELYRALRGKGGAPTAA